MMTAVKKFLIEALILVFAFSNYNCKKAEKQPNVRYFSPGQLSQDEFKDSIFNKHFSESLLALKEPVLGEGSDNTSIRLSVSPSHYNFYCIRVDRIEKMVQVTIKIAGDRSDFKRAGLSGLTLSYQSNHQRMDSLYDVLLIKANDYDFYPGFDNADFVAADGTDYLLEKFSQGDYKVVIGWNGGRYVGKENLFDIINCMHFLVPEGLIPDLKEARELEDVLFSVMRRDTIKREVVH